MGRPQVTRPFLPPAGLCTDISSVQHPTSYIGPSPPKLRHGLFYRSIFVRRDQWPAWQVIARSFLGRNLANQVGSLCMMSAPSLEHNRRITKDDVDTAAVVASFCLAGGLTLGSVANFGIRAIICRCNPFIN